MIAKTLRGDFPGRVVFHADRGAQYTSEQIHKVTKRLGVCLLYTSDAADDSLRVDLGGRRIIKKKK